MEMPVIVGVIITVAFLVSFSEWFYTLCKGISVVVLDDIFYVYRIIGMSLVSLLFMIGVFAAIAIVKECPNENREGIFANLTCREYLAIKVTADDFFEPQDKTVNQAL